MEMSYLDKYAAFTKTLHTNDIKKANSMIEKGLYEKTLHFMLENNVKLEQEVISWMEKYSVLR